MRWAFSFWFVFSVLVFGYVVSRRLSLREGYLHACRATDADFYRDDAEIRDWVSRCFAEGSKLPTSLGRAEVLDLLSARLREIDTSHFYLEGPPGRSLPFFGSGPGTGIHARYVDGRLVIYRLAPGSSAAAAGLAPGDEIVEIPDVEEVSPRSATFRTGVYHLVRAGRPFSIDLRAGPVVEPRAMTVESLANGARVLTVPTFDAPWVDSAAVDRVAREIAGAPRLVVDVRENVGGAVSGVQRLMGLFVPAGTPLGSLESRFGGDRAMVLDDAIAEWGYGWLVDAWKRVDLRVAPGHEPYRGPVTVLIESQTASAAEVFADAMKRRPNTRVWGWPTAGAVIQGKTHPIPEFGFGFTLVVPHVTVKTADGRELEKYPVEPDRTLFHDLGAALRGEDDWISAAAR